MKHIFDSHRPDTRYFNSNNNASRYSIASDRPKSYWMRSLLLLLITSFLIQAVPLSAQSFTPIKSSILQGKVTDSEGTPLAGVHISTAPVHSDAYSDYNGRFRLTINGFTKHLLLVTPGFQPECVTIKKAKFPLIIQLQKAPKRARDSGNNLFAQLEKIPGISVMSGNQANFPAGQIMIRGVSGQNVAALRAKMPSVYFTPRNNTESYAHIKENGFKAAAISPLSTFSIDVDKASYSNVRRFINEGHLPPANAVRIEELINYFDYHYKQPTGKDPVNIQTELGTAPWNPRHYLLHIGLQAKKVGTDELPPSNLVFLIDVSGSMAAANKLPLLITSFKMLTDQLREQDYVSIVTYAGNAENVLAPTSGADKKTIKKALDQLSAYGSTNGAGGLEKAYAMAEQHYRKEGNNRIILASDGDFNVGASSLEDLEKLIASKRKSGIFLSVLGFGMGNLKDDKMETLADKGNGNYAYIDNSSEARRVLLKEFGGTLFTVAKDVKVQVEFNPAVVQAYRLVGYENRALNDADFNQDTVDAGEMGSGSKVTALYEIIPQGLKDHFSPNVDTLRYVFDRLSKKEAFRGELARIKIRYKRPDGKKSNPISQIVADKRLPGMKTSVDFQLAAAAAGWGMLLKNSQYVQDMTYSKVAELIKKTLESDRSGQVGGFLNLVETSEALAGNEIENTGNLPCSPILIHPRRVPGPAPRPIPRPGPIPQRDTVSTFRILPVSRSVPLAKALQGKMTCVSPIKNK
ncbi:YfbK domain-containing protein [Arachidicoccus terrestris]|uniref:YfbK domain-containing protein n=1 Tax=Arachidicoccus terrestris TaxID=2875539 RepID=UPI001CC6D2D2|nr:von Willebrand factor type A domain-containing protein [Arachidicoccus terrestris]UAY56320.1 von Willebrand factor type A domain-containing protein [Arachidicoccus terrestris]